MKDMIKMVAAIVIFATVACAALAVVYDATKDKIEANKTAKLNAALKVVFPDADDFPQAANVPASGDAKVTLGDAYTAQKDGQTVGVAVNATIMGFSDNIVALVGVGVDGKITGVQILQNVDTPGLGAKASLPAFYGQFAGMTAADGISVKKDGGTVTAITAATISSRAVSALVEAAAKAGSAYLAQNGGSK